MEKGSAAQPAIWFYSRILKTQRAQTHTWNDDVDPLFLFSRINTKGFVITFFTKLGKDRGINLIYLNTLYSQ